MYFQYSSASIKKKKIWPVIKTALSNQSYFLAVKFIMMQTDHKLLTLDKIVEEIILSVYPDRWFREKNSNSLNNGVVWS